MKKLLISISFLICALYSYCQFPVQQNLGGPNTQVNARGGMGSDSGFVYRSSFNDTVTANFGFLKNIPGITIRTVNTLWIRSNGV